jgi:hypothetical protein
MWLGTKVANPVLDFGGDDTGTSLATTAWLLARDKAVEQNIPFVYPPGVHRIDQEIIFPSLVPIYGPGKRWPIVRDGSGYSVFRFQPTASDWHDHEIENVYMVPGSDVTVEHGIIVELSLGAHYAYAKYSNVKMGDAELGGFAKEGLFWDNSIGNNDGFFENSVEGSFISNGLKCFKIGDSNIFDDVHVHGRGCVTITGNPNARKTMFVNSQITTMGGFLNLQTVNGFKLLNTWMEHPFYLGPYEATGLEATVLLQDCEQALFRGNTYNTYQRVSTEPAPAHMVACSGFSKIVRMFDEEFITRGWASHVYATPSTQGIRCIVSEQEKFAHTPAIVLQGSP